MVETSITDSVVTSLALNKSLAAYRRDSDIETSDIVDVTLALEGNQTCVDSEEWLGVDSVTWLLEGCVLPVVAFAGLAG